jgi:hypothetical protein
MAIFGHQMVSDLIWQPTMIFPTLGFPMGRNIKGRCIGRTLQHQDAPANCYLYLTVWTMLGLNVTTNTRHEYLGWFIVEYEKCCKVEAFYLQGIQCWHVWAVNLRETQQFLEISEATLPQSCSAELCEQGTSWNQDTRVGEGFQQEVSAMYKIANGKNVEHQVCLMSLHLTVLLTWSEKWLS